MKVRTATRITGMLAMLVFIAMMVGFVILETWPARPRTWIGWAMALLAGVPLLLLGEYAGAALTKHGPVDPGWRVSIKRMAWLLAFVFLIGCVAVAALRVQSWLFGDPLAAWGS